MVEDKIEALIDYEVDLLETQDDIENLISTEQSRFEKAQKVNKIVMEENEKLVQRLKSLKVTYGILGIASCKNGHMK